MSKAASKAKKATAGTSRSLSPKAGRSSPIGKGGGTVGPVIARFEQMPTRYAALIWNRVLYLDTLDAPAVYDFYLRYGERLAAEGTWITPPEPQCPAPTASPSPSGG